MLDWMTGRLSGI